MAGISDTQEEEKKYLDSHFFSSVFHQSCEYLSLAKLREKPDDGEPEWVSFLEI